MLKSRSVNDPFEHVAELTASALTSRPRVQEASEPVDTSLSGRFSAFLDRVLLADDAANDAVAVEYDELHRYYY